jgi:hypothetical protein
MEFLDEKGHDRLTVGESLIPQSRAWSSQTSTGLAPPWASFCTTPRQRARRNVLLSNGRGAIAFDYPERDAIGMYVDDKGDTDKAPGAVKAAPCEDSISPLEGGRL